MTTQSKSRGRSALHGHFTRHPREKPNELTSRNRKTALPKCPTAEHGLSLPHSQAIPELCPHPGSSGSWRTWRPSAPRLSIRPSPPQHQNTPILRRVRAAHVAKCPPKEKTMDVTLPACKVRRLAPALVELAAKVDSGPNRQRRQGLEAPDAVNRSRQANRPRTDTTYPPGRRRRRCQPKTHRLSRLYTPCH